MYMQRLLLGDSYLIYEFATKDIFFAFSFFKIKKNNLN